MRKIEGYWRSAVFFGTLLLILGLIAIPASAQTTVSATTTTGGNWTTTSPTATWTCIAAVSPCLPNDNSNDVFNVGISGETVTVTLDNTSTLSNITINSLSIAESDTLDTESGATLTLAGANNLTNAGNLFVGASGSTNGTTLKVGGNLTNNGGLMLVGGNATNGAVEVAGSFDNTTGDLDIEGGNTAGVPSEVNVSTAAPSTFEGVAQVIGLTGGAILNYGSGAITTIGGGTPNTESTIILDGTNAAVEIAGASGNSALTTLANIASNGQLDLFDGAVVTTNSGVNLTNSGIVAVGGSGVNINGATLNVGGNLTNSGTLDVGGFGSNGLVNAMSVTNSGVVNILSNGTVSASTYTQTGGTTDVDGTLISSTINVSGGTLTGTGSIVGNMTLGSGGTLLPGEPGTPGTLTLADNGNLSFAGGTLDETINSDADNGFSVLNVSGTLDLTGGADLDILLASDFTPAAGEQFLFATAGSLDGQFTITDPLFDNGQFQWVLSATGDAVDIFLTVQPVTPSTTPEPASLLLFGTGLLGLAWITRRRMKVGA